MNGPIKRLLLSLALSLPAATSMAQGLSAGVFLGSPMSGVTVSQYDLRLSFGVKDLGVAVDRVWNLGEWLARPDLSLMYGYTGALWVDDDNHKWGPRAGVGVAMPMGTGNIELYGEAGSTWYWQDDATFKFEGAFGLRAYF